MATASERFNTISNNFLQSEVHRSSPTIARLHELLREEQLQAICDIACGAGHLGLSFAGRVQRIVAVDPAPNMLEVAARQAFERGLQLETHRAPAEKIPLEDQQFDLVTSRLAPHHFSDIQMALKEMARLAKRGGWIAIIDLEGHSDPAYDEFNHRLEMLHDPTHVRSYTAERWLEIYRAADLEVVTMERKLTERPGGVSVSRWCEIASSGPEAEKEINRILVEADHRTLSELGIREESCVFYMPVRTLLVLGRKKV